MKAQNCSKANITDFPAALAKMIHTLICVTLFLASTISYAQGTSQPHDHPFRCQVTLSSDHDHITRGAQQIEAIKKIATPHILKAAEKTLTSTLLVQLREFLESDESSFFFDPRATTLPDAYEKPATEVTIEDMSKRLISEIVDLKIDETKHIKHESKLKRLFQKTRKHFKNGATYVVKWGAVATFGILTASTLAPFVQPLTATLNAKSWEFWVGGNHSKLETSLHDEFDQIYRVSARIPLTEIEGRSYYYEALALAMQNEQMIWSLLAQPPNSGDVDDIKVWRETLQFYSSTLESLPKMFPDAFSSEQGQKLKNHQTDLIKYTQERLTIN